jgi:hypothetical protein
MAEPVDKLGVQLDAAARAMAEVEDYLLWGARLLEFMRAFDRYSLTRDTSLRPVGARPPIELALIRLDAALLQRLTKGRW